MVKLLSAAYRIPLTRMMGASLMGHYSAVLNVFMPFFSVATAGITPALSRFTAQLNSQGDDNGIYRLSRRALRLYISIAAVTSCFYLVFSKIYAQYIGENI
ncbi:MAG: oligosaccharide flippase family protein, partial [Oscillospiraceae bacterium]|nr:oligosaccharide flippase family protein [Oscillospiraceae bacterium]